MRYLYTCLILFTGCLSNISYETFHTEMIEPKLRTVRKYYYYHKNYDLSTMPQVPYQKDFSKTIDFENFNIDF